MIRVLLLGICCCGIIGLSRGFDDQSKVPACEDGDPDHIYLDLSGMEVQAIRRPIANSAKITCLNLAGNRISYIDSTAFDGLPELHYLNLAGNPVSYNDLARTELAQLRTLVLDGPLFADNRNREELYQYYPGYVGGGNYDVIRDYQDEDVPPAIWLPELETLSLGNNGMEDQDRMRSWIQKLETPNLTHLHLTGNNLGSDDVLDILSNMNNLTHLYLDNNRLHDLPGNTLQNIRYLSMDRNVVQSLGVDPEYRYVPTLIPLGMVDLEYLSLANNEIAHIGLDAFRTASNLRFLNLAGNKFGDISSDAFSYLTSLRNLTLDNNLLTSVPVICELNELRSLSLSGNEITSIDEMSFCNLQQLSAIYLKNNDLQSIEDETFGHLNALQVLDLSANKIVSLSENWIAPHNFIVELHLDSNNFMNIEDMSLKRIHGLQSLSIGHNPMKTITLISMLDLPNTTTIDVSREIPPIAQSLNRMRSIEPFN